MVTERKRAYQKQYRKRYNQENKEALREYQRLYYNKHPEMVRERDTRRKQELREFIIKQKMMQVCVRCGNSDFRVLDFHHIDKDSKEMSIGEVVANGWSEARILKEIAKCEVLCANCHRIHHWEEWNG